MNDGVVGSVTGAPWRVGWHPVPTASFFAVVGVLAGYFAGQFGAGTAVFGGVFVAVGVLVPSVRKTGVGAAVVAVVVFFGVGAEAVVETARRFGLDARGPAEEISGLVLDISPADAGATVEATEVVGGAVAWLSVSSLGGAAVGVAVWLVCAAYVNKVHAGVREELLERVREAGEEVLGGEVYTLTHPVGTVPVVGSARRYDVANLRVSASSVEIHHGSVIDMESRAVDVGEGTEEVYYDRISSVGYDGRRLRIRTADGEPVNVVTSEKPGELLKEVRENLRAYKDRHGRTVGADEAGGRGGDPVYEREVGTEEATDAEAASETEGDTKSGDDEVGDDGDRNGKSDEDSKDRRGGGEAVFTEEDDVEETFQGSEDAEDLLSGDIDGSEDGINDEDKNDDRPTEDEQG
jgi:hypothetical protein